MMKSLLLFELVLLLTIISGFSQAPGQLEKFSQEKTVAGLLELKSFLGIPNDALYSEDIEKNIEWLHKAFRTRGFETEVLPTARTPLFLASREFQGAEKTVLFYMHFDGQGVDPGEWEQPDPYVAVLKEKKGDGWETISWDKITTGIDPEWRIFARSSSDDKGPIIMFLSAIDILDKELDGRSRINIKVILDGEEEKGSRHLSAAVEKFSDKLRADYMIINDGPIHASQRPTIVFGCRGIAGVSLTVYGPGKPQHSGHYGNYAPNPVFRMAELLAGMKDDDGRVTIPGYYEGIVLDDVQDILKNVPDDPAVINKTIGIAEPDKVGRYYQESLQYPSLNVRGMQSAWVGDQARTIVPDKAVVSIDLRLVPESDPDRLKMLIREYIEEQGYYVIDRDPTEEERLSIPRIAKYETGGATLPFRTEIQSEIGEWLTGAIGAGMGREPVLIRIMGGSVPVAPFIITLDVPAVIIPLVNPDNNQHAPNENLRIWNFTNGIQVFLSILTQ